MIKSLLEQVFGVYTPISYTDANSIDIIPDGLAGVDIPYVLGALLFGLTFYCFMRLLGAVIKK